MRHLLARVARGLAGLIALYYVVCIAGLAYVRVLPPPITMVQIQRAAEAALEPGDYRRRSIWRRLGELPAHVPRAVVAAEDARFWSHQGFDWEEVEAAQDDARRSGRAPRGASTITQQLVKNLFLTTHRSWVRKGVELTLTPVAEMILPKRRILELYLNVVEWGPGVYGIEAAARHHYRVPAARLTRDQAARLAAVLPAPRRRRPARMGAYAGVILERMRSMGW